MLGYIIQVPINWGHNWGQSNINLSRLHWLRALSIQAEGGFLMLEYQKSSAAFSLNAQLLVCVKLMGTKTAVRSCVRMGWVGDDFWYPSMRNPPTPSSHSELRNNQAKPKPKSPHPRLKLRLTHLPKHKSLQISSPLHALIGA